MSLGIGNTFFSQKQSPGGGILGADNGLTVNAGIVQLGGSLVQNTILDLVGFPLYVNNGIDRILEMDPGVGRYLFGRIDGGNNQTNAISFEADSAIIYAGALSEAMKVTISQQLYQFGDILGTNNGTQCYVEDQAASFMVESLAGAIMQLRQTAGSYVIGDIDGNFNASTIQILDSGFQIILNTGQATINMAGGGAFPQNIVISSGSNAQLSVNHNAGQIQFGNNANNVGISINGVNGFTGTVTPVNSITVNNGIVTNVT